MKRLISAALFTALAAPTIAVAQTAPPVAAKKPHEIKAPHGATRQDEYYWLRDDERKNPEMLAYLNAENAYADSVLAPSKGMADTVYGEIVSHIKQDDSSVPVRRRGYYYYTRFDTGADYAITARRKGDMSAPEEIIFNQPEMAKGKGFFQIGGWDITRDGRYVAYAEDTVGRRQYVVRIKDLQTGAMLTDTITNVSGTPIWSDDGKSIFYVDKDPVTLLSKRIKVHVIGTPATADKVIYEEKDDSFYIGIGRTSDDRFICIYMESTVSSEQKCAPAANPATFASVAPRQRDFEYSADHVGNRWIIRTNWNAKNYKLMTVEDGHAGHGRGMWKDLVPVSDSVFIEDFTPFNGFLAIEERSGGNKRLRILTDAGKSTFVEADEPAYTMALGGNTEVDTPWVRYTYGSLVTPTTTYETNVQTGERRTLKVQPVPGYDPSRYVTERVWATARDGTKIPVSLVYAKGFKKDGTAALYQEAYGSYGSSSDPYFSASNPSLLDRGMVVAIAHIRGGQEMGRGWYDDGHLLNKKNSFTDFIDVTRWLVANGYAKKGRVGAMGGSAGGLLMGAVANMAPEDYGVIIAQVPFVDVVTTMLDASIPLTTNEYDEWGNPADKKFYDYMLSYSPYDNVAAQNYPALFVGTGLWDSQVQYYEPAKWVARLRAKKTDSNPLVFRTNMEAGHGGKSGRFERYRQEAEWTAFMFQTLGVK
ncbi:S9 family peptidase [Sphingomonas sp. G-3-2-10]|uniref:S9 family peptidase n=1 Tax=Sphingomonas sp. G-3-2-10 TaxID=2728838 RepID=UPI00146B3A94|nr:S9 family peptidase [Sphingomonas sp. G-3-2-10]NML06206.1 S9 family peptidase [Sphingomonas sp. G-3-2-10]